MFNKFSPLPDGTLKTSIEEIARRYNKPIRNILTMDASKRSKHGNAFFTGIGKNKRLVLFDTLLEYPEEEIIAVFCHELGHQKKKHIKKQILFMSLLSFVIAYFIFWFYQTALKSFSFPVHSVFGVLFYSFLITSGLLFFLNPILNYFLRINEYEADAYAIHIMQDTKPMINVLKRLTKDNLSNINPLPLYSAWHYSHPSTVERIKAIENYPLSISEA